MFQDDETPEFFHERFFKAVLSELPVGICVNKTGINPEYVVWNRALEKMTGIKSSDALGLTCYKLFSPAEADMITSRNAITLKDGRASRFSSNVLHGKLYDIIEIPLGGNDGAGTYIITIFTDITEQRKIMERLVHAEKMQVTGQLAGGIAHDFNNQLMSIQGYAYLIKEKLSDPELEKYIDMILTSAEKSAGLTGKLLAFSRKGKNTDQSINIHVLLDEVTSLAHFRYVGSMDRIVFRKKFNAAKKHTRGDISLLQNAFLNIVINSMEAFSSGSAGIIRLETENIYIDSNTADLIINDIKNGQYIKITVADNGTGILHEHIRRIFEPFFTTKKAGEGTGMGLAAVFGTVKSHNGTISLKSDSGTGTSISLYLPVEEDESDNSWVRGNGNTNYQKKEAYSLMENKTAGKILVVDDEKIVRELSGEMLKRLGYETVLFENAASAISFYRDNWKKIDLAMLDMIMPQMGGLETFQELKKINPDISAVILSGYCLDNESKQLFDEGIAAFIQKPVSLSVLKEKIDYVLKNKNNKNNKNNNESAAGISITENIPVIKGLDTQKALDFLDGDINLYYKLIDRFKLNYSGTPEDLKKRYLDKDYEWIYITAHSIKSLAGSLGDNNLYEASENVENAVKKTEYTLLNNYIPELSDKITGLLEILENASRKEEHGAVESKTATRHLFSDFIHELKDAVSIHSPRKCRDVFEKNRNVEWDSTIDEQINDIKKAVSMYDFKKAKAVVNDLESKYC